MKKLLCFALVMSMQVLQANCQKCERVRQYHEEHPEENYEYYEDYLQDKKEGKIKSNSAEEVENGATSAEKIENGE